MTFTTPTSLTSIASFTAAGTYTLKLTASDGSLSASSNVQVTVSPAVVVPPTQTPAATTGQVLYPTDAGILNVKTTYGAKGDGVTDDTAALRNAIRDFYAKFNSTNVRYGFLYFPDGTYLVSDTLDWKDSNGAWHGYLAFRGQSQSGTIIKLKDNAAGFGSPATPKAVSTRPPSRPTATAPTAAAMRPSATGCSTSPWTPARATPGRPASTTSAAINRWSAESPFVPATARVSQGWISAGRTPVRNCSAT